jgi:hypothetical protein
MAKKPVPAVQEELPNIPTVASLKSVPVAPLTYDHVPATGFEEADRDSYLIPRLVILQKMSPQLDRGSEAYIKEAQDGDILNTATLEVYSGETEGIVVLPVSFKRSFTKWLLREKGGGFKGEVPPTDPLIATTKRDEKNRDLLPGGEEQLVDTRTHAVIMADANGKPTPALISFTSTQIKDSKRWMTQMREMHENDRLPMYAHMWRLTTNRRSNDKGSWSGWVIEHEGLNASTEMKKAAEAFVGALSTGALGITADANIMAGGKSE